MSAVTSPQTPSATNPRQGGPGSRRYDADATILLVGFIGAGKKTLGFIASAALRRRFIDFEESFQTKFQSSPQEYAAAHGFAQYREAEVALCQEILTKHQTGCVIAGLGVTASFPSSGVLATFTQQHPVIYVRRDKSDIQQFIGGDPAKFERIFAIGNAFFESISNFDFFNITQEAPPRAESKAHSSLKLKEIERVFVGFLRRIFGKPQLQLFSADAFSESHTYALQLSLCDLEAVDFNLDALDAGADAINVLLDHESYSDEGIINRLSRYMTTLRKHTRVPIIIDARVDERKPHTAYRKFLGDIIRVAPDAFTLSTACSDIRKEIHSIKGHSTMVVLHNHTEPLGVGSPDALITSIRASFGDSSFEAFHLVGQSAVAADTLSCVALRRKLRDILNIPVIAYNNGPGDRASKILNPTLCPLTVHSHTTAELSMQEAQHALTSLSLYPKKKFVIVGQDVRLSLSPPMHQSGYTSVGLPHTYIHQEVQDFREIEEIFRYPSFGGNLDGIAISLPFKTDVLPLLDKISPDAQDIKAVNTVILDHRIESNGVRTPFYHGYNTDYIGIKDCIYSHLSPANAIREGSTALIIGAGGMARAAVYACYQLGVRRVLIYNRTLSNAQSLIQYFRDWARSREDESLHLDVIESINDPWPSNSRFPTIVVSCIPGRHPDTHAPVELKISDQWLESRTGGVYVEVGYGPFKTVLMEQLTPWSNKGWVLVDGLKVLVKQGIAQYELFTRRPAPIHIMRRAVQEEALKHEYFHMW
ncbi:unnamed protein product [Penicillium salamii]|nr:unnamed protein product [Penicillium salamii]